MPDVVTTADPEWIPWSIRAGKPVEADPRERHLAELRRLTFGGESAGASWSPDGKKLIFQRTPRGAGCERTFVMDLGSGEAKQVSPGEGKSAGGSFFPAGDRILYASTRAAGAACPAPPDRARGHGSPLDDFDVYSAAADGSDARALFASSGYDAETAVAPDGSRLVFTSTRDDDLELYTANLDGTSVRRITRAPGYDGGAAFSPDSTRLVWRAARPAGAALDEYRALLAQKLVRPGELEIWTAGAEGQNARRLTGGGHTSSAPAFAPDSRRVIFASDRDAANPSRGGASAIDLYVIDPDGPTTASGGPAIERITFADGIDGAPVFSPDGRYLAFTSSRAGETDVFVARWVP
jgi:TolB protein